MRPIGDILKPLEGQTKKARTRPTSSTDGGEALPPPPGRHGGDGRSEGPDEERSGEPCALCGGVGWRRKAVPVGHPEFGKAFPCECIADELASRRLAGLKAASSIATLDDMTFDSFQVEAPGNSPEQVHSLRAARDAARAFAGQPSGWLLLYGGYGSGKTHLAAAIVNQRLRLGAPAVLVVVPDLLDHLRAGFATAAEETYDERLESVRNAPLLVLDDLGTQAPTAWAAEKLFQLLNHRYNARLPTVVTTNCRLEDLDERLRSRLSHVGLVRQCEIKALDYRGGSIADATALSSLHMYADMTFQTWDHRTGALRSELAANLRRAFDLARSYADEPVGWLVLSGEHGSGKTHLVAAIANHRMALGAPVVFVVVPDLLDHLRATFSPSSRVEYDQRFDEVRSAPLLVLDDLGVESATSWAREKLYQILNHRYAARLPTVVSMAMSMADVPARLRTRMLDRRRCTIFEILAPAYFEVPPPAGSRSSRGRSR